MAKAALSAVLLFFLVIPGINAKTYNEGEIAITNISVKCIDTIYVPSSRQVCSETDETRYEIGHCIYELKVSIELFGIDLSYNKPLALTVFIPNERIQTIIVNQELIEMYPEIVYDFFIIIKTKEKGWSKITIEAWDSAKMKGVPFDGMKTRDGSFTII